ncbi:hypothetical protein HF264_26005 [Rhizobium leguminosarum]|uniref:phospholipase D family protein n=1 Tax=Rhizobium TaxID=379 RepID=UPI001C919D7A|nr:phospholipase D family protein [Rhizobium leguminosarum]MBY2943111.1 hypothetical protein [Rhizobium leguminosarum]
MPIVTGPNLFEQLKAAVSKSVSVRLAIAFWGGGAVDAIGLTAGHKIEIICNLEMGGTNPDEIEEIIRLGAKVHAHKTLHAKMGIASNFGFLGSSNASANGLGLQGAEARAWEELNVIFENAADIDRLNVEFARLKSEAGDPLKIGDHRITLARERWQIRKTHFPPPSTKEPTRSVLELLKSDPESLKGKFAYLAISLPVEGEDAARFANAEEAVREEFGKDYSVYRHWPDLPTNAFLLDFTINQRTASFNGIWRREPALDKPGDKETQVCRRIRRSEEDFPIVTKEDEATLRAAVLSYWRAQRSERQVATAIDLYEFGRYWLSV